MVFTGAGVSTESGIPDFRGPNGLWQRLQPILYQDFITNPEARRESWQRSKTSYQQFASARPNAAHLAIADLERMGKISCVVTQNIDNLHRMAGSQKVIELHGNSHWVACLSCNKRYARSEVQDWLEQGVEVPVCPDCGGIMKTTVISFGEAMPEQEVREAERAAQACDVCLVVGSSLVVYPAAYIPRYAKQAGARLVLLNDSETDLDGRADAVLRGRAGQILPPIVEQVRRLFAAQPGTAPLPDQV
jgi:NAD-dependent deacetylase